MARPAERVGEHEIPADVGGAGEVPLEDLSLSMLAEHVDGLRVHSPRRSSWTRRRSAHSTPAPFRSPSSRKTQGKRIRASCGWRRTPSSVSSVRQLQFAWPPPDAGEEPAGAPAPPGGGGKAEPEAEAFCREPALPVS